MKKNLIIIGAGGAGRETVQIAIDINKSKKTNWELLGFLDDTEFNKKKMVMGLPVIGKIEGWKPKKNEVYICSIADTSLRKSIIEDLEMKGAEFINLIHPSVIISEYCNYSKGLIVYPNTVISVNTEIGKHVIINMHNSIGHDSKIGEYSVLSSFCDVTGYVNIGNSVFLGSHVTIAPKLKIGDNSVVGIGSVVTNSVKNERKVFGNPARIFKI